MSSSVCPSSCRASNKRNWVPFPPCKWLGPLLTGNWVVAPVEGEPALRDAIGEPADDGSEGGTPRNVLIDGLVAEHHVSEPVVLVGHQNLDDLAALVGDLHRHPGTRLERVEICLLTADLLLKCFPLHLDVCRPGLSLRSHRRAEEDCGRDHREDPFHHLDLPGWRWSPVTVGASRYR